MCSHNTRETAPFNRTSLHDRKFWHSCNYPSLQLWDVLGFLKKSTPHKYSTYLKSGEGLLKLIQNCSVKVSAEKFPPWKKGCSASCPVRTAQCPDRESRLCKQLFLYEGVCDKRIMENLLELESTFFKEGYAQGVARGEEIGFENGVRHGKEEGHSIGFEMGFAQGVAEACATLFASKGDQQVVKAADALSKSVSRVSLDKIPAPEDVQRARARFKVLESRVGVNLGSTARRDDMTF